MSDIEPLQTEGLRRRCDPQGLGFQTTADIEPAEILVGQDRAADALRFATKIDRSGYNLYVIGGQGYGRHRAVRQFLDEIAKSRGKPDEWVYVHNFQVNRNPKALRLPPGTAVRFRKAMVDLIDDLKSAIPSLFETEDYRNRIRAIGEEGQKAQEDAFEELRQKADAEDIAILRTPMGFALAPVMERRRPTAPISPARH